MPTAFALLGPTASGKSALAATLAAEFPLEIVSVDSAQVYRGLDIGTAKPSAAERARVPHHLVDIAEPTERYSAARFRADAIRACEAIFARGRIPLLVGGAMLYYRALAFGLDALPAADAALRAEIAAEAAQKGWPVLHAELARADPDTAARIAPWDRQRIQRALEVLRTTGVPVSRLRTGRPVPPPFALAAFALVPADRPALHRRIAERLDAMLAAGLVEELRELRRHHRLDPALPSMRAVGYRQAWRFLEGEIGFEELRVQAIAATRQLARRQLAWLRALPGLESAERLRAALSRA